MDSNEQAASGATQYQIHNDRRILGQFYKLLWKGSVDTFAQCEYLAAHLAELVAEHVPAERLWEQKPDVDKLFSEAYPFDDTTSKLADIARLHFAWHLAGRLYFEWSSEAGGDLLEHLFRVVERLQELYPDNIDMQIAAILSRSWGNDLYTEKELEQWFGKYVMTTVQLLTESDDETWQDWARRIQGHSLAEPIMLIKIEDFFQADDIDQLGTNDVAELFSKYGAMLAVFGDVS